MKKFTAILLFAVLALGCVFAASGDVVVLETTVEEVKPLFEIYGGTVKGLDNVGDKDDAAADAANVVNAQLKEDDTEISLVITLNEVGLDTENARKNYIRYKGNASITVQTDVLRNVKNIDGTLTTNTETGILKTMNSFTSTMANVTATVNGVADKIIHKVTSASIANGVANIKLNYTGSRVAVTDSATGSNVATWTWTWDTTALIGGETYRTDIKITYQID